MKDFLNANKGRIMDTYHRSVLLHETIAFLQVEQGKKYIDGTLGGGGHTGEILERGGKVLGIDMDEDALRFVGEKFEVGEDLVLAKGNFRDIDVIAKENKFEKVSGVLLDLGVSSHHFDEAERGFSLQKEGPLDMRMDRDLGVKAGDLVNILTKGELYELFTKFGEERFARSISDGITRARKVAPIKTTSELAGIVSRVVPKMKSGVHPATRVFQALRIVVNDELHSLEDVLPKALELLVDGGRIAVISFHSLEDRIVKNQFKDWKAKGVGIIVTKKPVIPSDEEIETNKRSRSAKLRVFEKKKI